MPIKITVAYQVPTACAALKWCQQPLSFLVMFFSNNAIYICLGSFFVPMCQHNRLTTLQYSTEGVKGSNSKITESSMTIIYLVMGDILRICFEKHSFPRRKGFLLSAGVLPKMFYSCTINVFKWKSALCEDICCIGMYMKNYSIAEVLYGVHKLYAPTIE